MADVRVNGKRFPILQAVDRVGILVQRLDAWGIKNSVVLTGITLNNTKLDLDNKDALNLKIDSSDVVEALMESSEQLALQSLQIAQEMAELLVFDLKMATLDLWDKTRAQYKVIEKLLEDSRLFLTLGARPIELLGCDLLKAPQPVENCLRQLDRIANNIEDAVLLVTHDKLRDACHVLVARVLPAVETWIKLSQAFAEELDLHTVEFRFDTSSASPLSSSVI